ncbi:MAG TPA: OmpA family protein [Stellaceae bacterium]|nr:OmpA family protein [Stellaceae bacterium]
MIPAIPAASAKPVAIDRRITHPDGASLTLKTIDFRSDAIVLSVTIANPGDRDIRLNRARSLILDDGAHGIYHLNPPADNPDLRIAARIAVAGELVFIGPLAPTTRVLRLSSNAGIGTSDNPYDDAPVFNITLPVEGAGRDAGMRQENHPDGAILRASSVRVGGGGCGVSLLAANGNDRAIQLNQNSSLTLLDAQGTALPPATLEGNPDLTVPPGDRLEATLVFPCRADAAGTTMTLVSNRGTSGTSDNPYDTLPVLSLKLPAESAGASGTTTSRASVAPIARSRLSPEATVAAATPPAPAAPVSPADTTQKPQAPAKPETSPAPETPPAPSATPAPKSEPEKAPAPPPASPSAPPPAKTPPAKTPPANSPPANSPSANSPSAKTPPTKTPAAEPQASPNEAPLQVVKTDRGLRIILSADELFGPSGDALQAGADPVLVRLGRLIVANHPRDIMVSGHTDSTGNDGDNQTLSDQRAHAVAAWIDQHAPKRAPHITEKGYGRTRPMAPNHKSDGSDNPEGRAQNRRIEILLRR